MSMQGRGGIPRGKTVAIDTTGRFVQFDALSAAIVVRASTNAVRLFFSKDDFDGNVNFWEVKTTDIPFVIPLEDRGVWLKGVAGTSDVQLLILHRKG